MNRNLKIDMPARYGHIPTLDGLRAVSIAIVVLAHIVSYRFPGGYGVFLFFVISGFLITRLLYSEMKANGSISLPDFYKRRIFRLYPVILIYCVIIVAATPTPLKSINFAEPLSALFYFANYLVPYYEVIGVDYQMPFLVFWSLSVEEHFYLVFPIAFLLLQGAPKKIAIFAATICLISILLRAYFILFMSPSYQGHYMYMHTEFRADSIAYGVLLASMCELPLGRQILALADRWMAALIIIILVALAVALPHLLKEIFRDVFRAPAVLIGISALLFGSTFSFVTTLLNFQPVAWLGKISYSLYVWHMPVHFLVQSMLPGVWIASIIASIAVAAASYHFVELPFIRMGRSLRLRTSLRDFTVKA